MFSEFELLQRYTYLDAHPVFVDVGAHHGHISKIFAHRGWRVLAFEPERNNWAALTKNTSGMSNVVCINQAVSDKNEQKVQFFVSDEHYGIHSLKPFHESHWAAYSVSTVRLDDALERERIQNVTCLKIDVEGADFLALKGINITVWCDIY